MLNHRGEIVIKGDPETGTYRFITNEARICMSCGQTINEGEEAEEDLVLVCSDCCVKYDKGHGEGLNLPETGMHECPYPCDRAVWSDGAQEWFCDSPHH